VAWLDRAILDRLVRALPDVPRWVETRSMLLSGRCEVFGLEEDEDLGFVVRDAEDVLISVVGRPGSDAIKEAVTREWEGDVVIAPPEYSSHVAGRCRTGEPSRRRSTCLAMRRDFRVFRRARYGGWRSRSWGW
jgi:hypothetical protein